MTQKKSRLHRILVFKVSSSRKIHAKFPCFKFQLFFFLILNVLAQRVNVQLLKSSKIKVEIKEIPQWIDSLGVVAKKGDIAWNKNV